MRDHARTAPPPRIDDRARERHHQCDPCGFRTLTPGARWGFRLLDFAKTTRKVHLEHYASGVFLYGDDEVNLYQSALATLHKVAMDRDQSAKLIAATAREPEGADP